MERILVTGGNGLLAYQLRQLQPHGTTFHFLGHGEFEITDHQQMAMRLNEINPHIVINTAAYNLVERCETERDLSFRAMDVLEKLSGKRPVGMRTASWDFSPWTLKIVRELKLLYDSSLMADDKPYELLEHGEPTGVVELPVEWIRDDAVYFMMHRFGGLRLSMDF